MRDSNEGAAVAGRDEVGVTPSKKPRVTIAAAVRTFAVGADFVARDETKIVRGRTIPLAI